MHLAAIYLAASSTAPLNIQGIEGILTGVLGVYVTAVAIKIFHHAFRFAIANALSAVCIVALGALVYGVVEGNLIGALGTALDHAVLKLH